MSVFTSLGILILSTLIIASMKLIPGVFALLLHYASGKFSKTKVNDLSIFFIFGTETMIALILFLISILAFSISPETLNLGNNMFTWIIIGILIALSLIVFFFYYRKDPGTKLFISRKVAKSLDQKACLVKTRSDAFVLGFFSGLPELFLVIPIYLVSIISITQISTCASYYSALIILLDIIAISPLFLIHGLFQTNHNLADIGKLRTKNKTFFRIFISLLYLLLAILIIIFEVL